MATAARILDMNGRRTTSGSVRRGRGPRAYWESARQTIHRSTLRLGADDARGETCMDQRTILLRKARYWDRNSALVNRLADLFTAYTVGRGLRVTPSSESEDWNRAALEWWTMWEQFADLSTRFDWGSLQQLMARELLVAGEYFVLLTSSPRTNRRRVQMVQPILIRTPEKLKDRENIVDGVELDPTGRPTAYYVHASPEVLLGGDADKYERIEARWMVHAFRPTRIDQVRGVTQFAPVLNKLHDLEDLQEIEQQAVRDNARITRVIKTESGEVDDEEAIISNGGDSDTDPDRGIYYEQAFGAEARVMMRGDEFQEFKSDRPSVATRDYWDQLIGQVCAGVNIPPQLVFPASINGTVARAVLDDANIRFRCATGMLVQTTQRVWNYVVGHNLEDEALRGAPEDWGRIKVHPPRAVNVDVGRNSRAMLDEYAAGMRTLAGIYAETGEDWRDGVRQKADELAYVKALEEERGLEPGSILIGQEPARSDQREPDGDEGAQEEKPDARNDDEDEDED